MILIILIKIKKIKWHKEVKNFLFLNLITEFFIDTTFKVVPVKFRPYKLLVIAGLPMNKNKPILVCLVLMKYNDSKSYDKLITYLIDNFNFGPKIIHFEKALCIAIKNHDNLKNDIIHIKCLFHFSQMIYRKLYKIGYTKKKLNKTTVEIIRNIELICFLNKDKIKEQQNLIIEKLNHN